jgi:hypothetical protein
MELSRERCMVVGLLLGLDMELALGPCMVVEL